MKRGSACPSCGASFDGKSCACGWQAAPPVSAQAAADRYWAEKDRGDREHLAMCQRWLLARGIVPHGMPKAAAMRAMAQFRDKLPQQAKPGPRDWAALLASRIADGEDIPQRARELAAAEVEAEERGCGLSAEELRYADRA